MANTIGTTLSAQMWTVYRGDTLSRTLSTIAADATITKVQLTVKAHNTQADSSAVMAIDTASGLLYLNGGSPGAHTGALTLPAGVLTIPASTMVQITPNDYVYDIQIWQTEVITTIEIGTFRVTTDITRIVS